MAKPAINAGLFRKVMINLDVILISGIRRGSILGEVVEARYGVPGAGGIRKKTYQLHRDWVHQSRGDDVAGKGPALHVPVGILISVEGIEDQFQRSIGVKGVRKIAQLLVACGHGRGQSGRSFKTGPVVIKKEKGLLLENRSTDGSTILVTLEVGFWVAGPVIEEVAGVQLRPAAKPVAGSMKLIRA